MSKKIDVVGAVIVDEADRILCTQRPKGKTLEFMWEFPGGKIELGEDPVDALKREVKEEMDTEIEVLDKITTTSYTYDFGTVILTTYYAKVVNGNLSLKEHIDKKWLHRHELGNIQFAPADLPAIEIIQEG